MELERNRRIFPWPVLCDTWPQAEEDSYTYMRHMPWPLWNSLRKAASMAPLLSPLQKMVHNGSAYNGFLGGACSLSPSMAMRGSPQRISLTSRNVVMASLRSSTSERQESKSLTPAPDADAPAEELTPLQQHVAFFDRNGDGIVYPWETYEGFRALGFNVIISFLGMVLINGTLSYPTLDSWIPSLLFPIYIKSIERAIHGSDTRVYNKEGRIVKEELDDAFAKFALSRPDALSFDELLKMTERNRDAYDLFGWTANKLEWAITYLLAKDDEGYVSKEAIAGVYDGSYFHYVEKQRNKSTSTKAD